MSITSSQLVSDPLWYKDAVIYELHIKAFQDQNGDGIGDFAGLTERLPYLRDLGITAIWLLPFYPSPQRDGGYDISDYYSINSDYGTLKEFRKFLKKAHKLGLRVITELVLNHTSDQHPWFQRARRAAPGSRYRDYYVWSDTQDKYTDARIIFQDFEASNWSWDPVAQAYYWHRFYSHQPDLNFSNPEVQEEVFRILDFWLEMGVDGFRLDAIPYLFEREGTNCENLPETHAFLKRLRAHVEEKFPEAMFLAEANMWPEDSVAYFGKGDECHMNYHFPIMPRMFMALKMEDRYPIMDIISQTPDIPATCQWAIFLRNHDELTLEMVTDEERDYMYRAYNKDPRSRINLGIRHRLAPLLDNNRKQIELMNCLLFSLPGTPVIYYGDEIGMGDNVFLGDRDGVRTPMQWSPDRNAGFSQANPQKLYLPLIVDPEYSFDTVNVETQQNNSSSLLWWMKRMIDTRKRFKAFGRGDIQFLAPENPKVLAFTRSYEEETLLVVANLSRYPQAVELDLKPFVRHKPTEVFSMNEFPEIQDKPYVFTLGGHGFYWFILEKGQEPPRSHDLPALEVDTWASLFKGRTAGQLCRDYLPVHLRYQDWFDHGARKIREVKLEQVLSLHLDRCEWLLLRVEFTEGFPTYYSLPVKWISGAQMDRIEQEKPGCLIARLQLGDERGGLVDALEDPDFLHFLTATWASKGRRKIKRNGLIFTHSRVELPQDISSRLRLRQDGQPTLVIGQKYALKLYRRLDAPQHPDEEVLRVLQDFEGIPGYLGRLELSSGQVTGTLLPFLAHQGSARDYFRDAAQLYYDQVLASKDEVIRFTAEPHFFLASTCEELPASFTALLGEAALERARLLGQTLGQLHEALAAAGGNAGFETEAFSLHYQRSLYSALQSQVRSSYQALEKGLASIPYLLKEEAQRGLETQQPLLEAMKKIFGKKLDAWKIRIHGDLTLERWWFTGKTFMIDDFDPGKDRSFSEARLRKSPLRDLASLIRSLHRVAYQELLEVGGIRSEDTFYLRLWAERWYQVLASQVMQAYLENPAVQNLLPRDSTDLRLLLAFFLAERSLQEMEGDMREQPMWAILSLRSIRWVLGE